MTLSTIPAAKYTRYWSRVTCSKNHITRHTGRRHVDFLSSKLNIFCLHSVKGLHNASTHSVAGLRRSDHITATLANFHWLRASERIRFKLATLVYRSLHGLALRYLSDDLCSVADIPSRRNLRSASSCQLEVPRTRLTSVGYRTFSAAGSRLWNILPRDITECQTVETFKRKLIHFMFSLSFPGLYLLVFWTFVVS